MQEKDEFQRLVKEFQESVKRYESLLLSWDSLDLARQDGGLCRRYSSDAIQTTKTNLRDEISFCGNELANLVLWLNNACAFSAGKP